MTARVGGAGVDGPVVVVDDVVTTGATVRRSPPGTGAAGWSVSAVAVVAGVRSGRDPGAPEGLAWTHGTRPGPWLRRRGSGQHGLVGNRSASRCQPQAKRPT